MIRLTDDFEKGLRKCLAGLYQVLHQHSLSWPGIEFRFIARFDCERFDVEHLAQRIDRSKVIVCSNLPGLFKRPELSLIRLLTPSYQNRCRTMHLKSR